MFDFPYELKYSVEHVWVSEDDENRASLGVTESFIAIYGQPEDVEFIGAEGEAFEAGDMLVRLNSDEEEVEVYAPVSGRVIEFNVELFDSPEVISEAPYNQGWLVRFELESPEELDELMSVDEYESFLHDEAERVELEEDDEVEVEVDALGLGHELELEPNEEDEAEDEEDDF